MALTKEKLRELIESGDFDDLLVMLSDYTAANILAKLKTVDGAGSGLDADTLDTLHAADFGRVTSSTWTTSFVLTCAENALYFVICSNTSGTRFGVYTAAYAPGAGYIHTIEAINMNEPSISGNQFTFSAGNTFLASAMRIR
jgi:hypothetical protein